MAEPQRRDGQLGVASETCLCGQSPGLIFPVWKMGRAAMRGGDVESLM